MKVKEKIIVVYFNSSSAAINSFLKRFMAEAKKLGSKVIIQNSDNYKSNELVKEANDVLIIDGYVDKINSSNIKKDYKALKVDTISIKGENVTFDALMAYLKPSKESKANGNVSTQKEETK